MGEHADSDTTGQPQRKRLRLPGFDYTQGGAYFITICTDRRIHLFGRMSGSTVVLNEVGGMVGQVWQNLPKYYPGIIIDEYVVMPDHLHGIVIQVDPKYLDRQDGPAQSAAPTKANGVQESVRQKPIAIPVLLRRYKSYTTRCYFEIKAKHPGSRLPDHVWQRSYYERVIRSESDYEEKREYIYTNPKRRFLKWLQG